MISDIELEEIESVLDSGDITWVERIAFYNLHFRKHLDQIVVSACGESPGPLAIRMVLGMLVRDRFFARFGHELDVPDEIIAQAEESCKERMEVLLQTWPEYPHEQIGRLVDLAAQTIMTKLARFVVEHSAEHLPNDLDFFIEYMEKNAVSDCAECIDFSTAFCNALMVVVQKET